MKKKGSRAESASARIDRRIEELGDWRGKTLARVRRIVKQADPGIVEEWKWKGTPCFSHEGLVCIADAFKSVVKVTFARGASLKDPSGLFNAMLDGASWRAIDIREGEPIDEAALKKLIGQAVALNLASDEKKQRKPGPRAIPIPPDLTTALREEDVLADWESLPPGKRLYLLKWIGQAVHEATRAKRVARAVEEAHQRREKRVDRL
ncbi:MAG TPA: DUF1801 domain-containing protein [Polyangiaceae bacterium]|nr:DUF1801 domain-containing protein [Polyangiaceae bacterium]